VNIVVALPADLIFAARMRATTTDVNVILAKDVKDFLTKIRELQPSLAVLDLDRRGIDVERVVRDVKATSTRLIAYGSHVREDLITAAQRAGADRVLARGVFVKQMAEILRGGDRSDGSD
jgi:DNA-binding NarL/FixJ family response regulator